MERGKYMVDVEALRFLEQNMLGLIKQQIVSTLVGQPGRWWTLAELAQAVGRPRHVVEHHLEHLVRAGIITPQERGGQTYYALAPDRQMRSFLYRIFGRARTLSLLARSRVPVRGA